MRPASRRGREHPAPPLLLERRTERGDMMTTWYRGARRAMAVVALGALSACSQAGTLGNVLGSVLGGGGSGQLQGVVTGVDTRAQQISVQQSNGQSVAVSY